MNGSGTSLSLVFRFRGSSQLGPVWLADADSKQYAEWGVDMMKYDYDDRKYKKDEDVEYIRDKKGVLILKTPATYQG